MFSIDTMDNSEIGTDASHLLAVGVILQSSASLAMSHVPRVLPTAPQWSILSTEPGWCCLKNSTDGAVEEGMTIVPLADGRPGETSGKLTEARAGEVSVGTVLCDAGGVKNPGGGFVAGCAAL